MATKVMTKIVEYEKRRIFLFWVRFGVIFTLILMAAAAGWWRGWWLVGERGTGELLELYLQDPEIINEYGDEVAATIMYEIPWELGVGSLGIFLVWGFVIISKSRRQINETRAKEIKKYERQNS